MDDPKQDSPAAEEIVPAAVSSAPDVSLDAALSADAEKLKDKKKKGGRPLPRLETKHILFGAGGVAFLMILLMVYSGQPAKGSMAYGICSTFLELNTPYPHTLRYIDLEGSRTAVRIYFTNIDPFGEYKQEMIECTYGPDPDMGMRLTQIARNRKEVDAETVANFNKILPTVIASDPYRIMPPDWKNPLLRE